MGGIAHFLAVAAAGYGNRLKSDEQELFKADLMNARGRWQHVDPAAFEVRLRTEGLSNEDVIQLVT